MSPSAGATRDRALELARAGREAAVAELVEELRIPSVSADPGHRADVRRNISWLVERLERMGLSTSVTDVEGGTHPVLQADWRGAGDAPTLTIYGHYDVQPPDPLELWRHPPFEPHIEDGKLYARGCSDNKGNHMAAIKAVEHLLAAGGPAVNIRFLIEGEEEIAGPALLKYIADHADGLSSEFTLVWDGGCEAGGAPALMTGLRGMLYTELEASGAAQDVHSGVYGGAAPNPINTLARVIGELKDRAGHVTIPGFYDHVREPDPAEISRLAPRPGLEGDIAAAVGSPALEGEAGQDLVRRLGFRPTLDANGIIGGFTGEGVKTVIPATARAKVSMRLVADQDPGTIFASLQRYVAELSTPGVKIEARMLASALPVLMPVDHSAARAASAAFEAAFGQAPVAVREGGTIPVAAAFQQHIGGEIVCSGCIQANAGAHSPNEWLSLDHYHRGTEMLIHFIQGLARSSPG